MHYGRRPLVRSLLTLGTPHLSTEQYPLGRVKERLDVRDPGAPPGVRGSSLQFANHFYPRGDCFPGVRVVCAVGRSVAGLPLRQALAGRRAGGGWLDAWLAYEGYKAACGRGDVEGDGVTPVCIAHLPGAHTVVLEGVWHTPRSKQLWYGSDEVVSRWERYLQEPGP